MKKILYGVSGIGNGHANRELPIILELAKDNLVYILCYDDSYTTFERTLKGNTNVKLIRIAVPFIVGTSKGLDFGITAAHPANKEVNFLKIDCDALEIVSREMGIPDLVISDYEPVCAAYAYTKNVPLVTIDQQSKFLYSQFPKELAGFTFEDEIQRLRLFFPKAASRISCSFFRTQKRIGGDEVTFFPAPIKPEIINMIRQPEGKKQVLVYISSAREFVQTPAEIIKILSEQKDTNFDFFVKGDDINLYQSDAQNIKLWPHGSAEFLEKMAKCDGIIATAGHSLLSEAMYLSIPVYAIPVAPYEQHINAKIIGDNGFGVSALKLIPEKLEEFTDNLNLYAENIREDKTVLVRGVGQDLIVDFLRKRFLSNRKILVFSPPFSGHLNILKEMICDLGDHHQFHLVITGWDNIKPDLNGLKDIQVSLLSAGELEETDPALWTFPRVTALMEKVLQIAEDFQPDLIIYDFFSIEGNLAGRIKNIPYWCSVPALMGPNDTGEYLREKLADKRNAQAVAEIEGNYGVQIKDGEVEMISDGMHLPGQINMVWSFLEVTPKSFKKNRADVPYVFCGNLRADNYEKKNYKNRKPLIYLSFGTVVMDNLWNQQPKTREALKRFIGGLAEIWKNEPYQIIFTTQGKRVLDTYPDNWWVYDNIDQVEILSRADLFITHGGSNSFHEAMVQKVPMVLIPFFGDQLLVAQTAEKLGLGRQVGGSQSIDTRASKNFLNKELVEKIDRETKDILASEKYAWKYVDLKLSSMPVGDLLTGRIPFKEGDLVLGESVLVPRMKEDLPVKVETYQKLIEVEERDLPEKIRKIIHVLKIYLRGCVKIEEKRLRIIDLFSRLFGVHCPDGGEEIDGLKEHLNDLGSAVTFYKKIGGFWVPENFDRVYKQKQVKSDRVIVMTSENSLKKETLKQALENSDGAHELRFIDPKLEFDEQLIGMENIVEAAVARAEAVRQMVGGEATVVSAVSGLVMKKQEFQDVAVVYVENSKGEMRIGKTAALRLPLNAVQKAKVRKFAKFTVGSVLGEEEASQAVNFDPHHLLTAGKISRKMLMAELIKELMS